MRVEDSGPRSHTTFAMCEFFMFDGYLQNYKIHASPQLTTKHAPRSRLVGTGALLISTCYIPKLSLVYA